jgi:hypothetical protein
MTSPNTPEKDHLTIEMENVITIDGRGRPKKAHLLLKLIQDNGIEEVMRVLGELSTRKFF